MHLGKCYLNTFCGYIYRYVFSSILYMYFLPLISHSLSYCVCKVSVNIERNGFFCLILLMLKHFILGSVFIYILLHFFFEFTESLADILIAIALNLCIVWSNNIIIMLHPLIYELSLLVYFNLFLQN